MGKFKVEVRKEAERKVVLRIRNLVLREVKYLISNS